jgi:hypothetical protein
MNLNNLKLPSWLVAAIANLMETAESVFSSPGSGVSKKVWVKTAALDLLERVDIPGIPDFIEQPVKEALIDVAIEVVWALLFAEHDTPQRPAYLRRLPGVLARA